MTGEVEAFNNQRERLAATVAAQAAELEKVLKDAERWKACAKAGEFPEYCHHDDTVPEGKCWYMPINGAPFQTPEEAIDAALAQSASQMDAPD